MHRVVGGMGGLGGGDVGNAAGVRMGGGEEILNVVDQVAEEIWK